MCKIRTFFFPKALYTCELVRYGKEKEIKEMIDCLLYTSTEYIKRMTRYRQSAPQRRQRIHDIAVAKVMAYNAGLMVFPDQKPAIFQQPDSGMDYEFQKACFYDSFEIKAQYDEMVKVKSTRAVGIILAKDAAYIVYSVGARIIKWTSTSERKLSSIMEGTLLNWQIQYDSWEAIMIGQDYDCLLYTSYVSCRKIYEAGERQLYNSAVSRRGKMV